ncbi:GntR family transcriptional regulator [Paenarthrobacter sp. NPDC090520]|uniref:GntR family transcriptional regulator n=1 Tax=Paenarthrobacter sp. NPDC090520 TaxID=3364382 RepID=UPI0038077304
MDRVAEASSKSQGAYRLILGMITEGSLPAGARINVAQLSGELDMSAVPIREALKLLEAEGLVEVLHNQGARVAAFDPVEYKEASELHAVLEAYAARISQPTLPSGTIDALRQANHDLREAFQDFEPHAFSEASIRFHSLLYAGCTNSALIELLTKGRLRIAAMRSAQLAFTPRRMEILLREHDEIIDMLESGADGGQLEEALRAHQILNLEDTLSRRVQLANPLS